VDQPAWSLNQEELLAVYNTSSKGISDDEAELRLEMLGKNTIGEKKLSLWKLLFKQFSGILIGTLLLAALVSVLIGHTTDAVVILFMLAMNGVIGFFQELKAEASLASLKKLTEIRHRVLRSGKLIDVLSTELVEGDLIFLQEGSVVTADIRLIESVGISADEALLTGESVAVFKDASAVLPKDALPFERLNMVLSGTTIVSGKGKGIVTATGERTYLASIASSIKAEPPTTVLAQAIDVFSKRYVALLSLIFTFLGLLGWMQGRSLEDLGIILLAGVVSAVPEGLPIVITVVLAIGALALSKKKTLIRYLPAVETLGSVTVIAADKTGTITQGALTVEDAVFIDETQSIHVAMICNTVHDHTYDPMDEALVQWARRWGVEFKDFQRIELLPFDAKLRLMAVSANYRGHQQVYIKGAYDVLREKAVNIQDFPQLDRAFETMTRQGLRVIALAFAPWQSPIEHQAWQPTIAGLVGFLDPPKKEVEAAVQAAKNAGVRVIMMTGDHPVTAAAIAHAVGIYQPADQIMTGYDLSHISEEELAHSLKTTTVLARILPEHKLKIVQMLQQQKAIVAMTGDGMNDVPALRAADIGIAMGSGSEAAQSAAEMVIVDNNLNVIVHAIRNARVIADNIRKVIYYLLSTSLMEIMLLAFSIGFNLPLPLFAIQVLWINIVTDGVLDKLFPFAKEEANVMARAPRTPQLQFMDRHQVFNILYFGGIMGLGAFLFYRTLLQGQDKEWVATIVFCSVVFAQWANGLQAQKESEPFFFNFKQSLKINPFIFIGIALGALLQMVPVYLLPEIFHCQPLDAVDWLYPIGFFFTSFLIVEGRKFAKLLIGKRLSRYR
jgi:Ca2+-transporting ATPase